MSDIWTALLGLGDNLGRDRLIHAEKQHSLTASIAPAKVEGTDIDAVTSQHSADPANKAGRVLVYDVEHIARKLCLDPDTENLDQTRRFAQEGARSATPNEVV